MKTPYDTAIRVNQREIDQMRVAITLEIEQLVTIEAAQVGADAAMQHEQAAAFDAPLLSTHGYLARMRATRARLADDKLVADARLTQLRDRAAAAYGTARAIEDAARQYREAAIRVQANSEQSELDDLAGASFHRRGSSTSRGM